MYCPMKFNNPTQIRQNCEKELCSWWEEDYNKCAIKDIAKNLSLIIDQGLDVNNHY